jgi:hypothetical protein
LSAIATDNGGAKTTSATVTITVTAASQTSYKINCGGSAASPFIADQNFSGGTTHSVTNAITTTGVTNPAPQAVYQSERYGTTTYTLPNLTTGAQYTVRLHFAELFQTASGKRKFNVVINGTTVLSNFDIYATAGGQYKAVVREFTATPNASGQIVINFNTITDNATVSGIEAIPAVAVAPVITTQPQSQTKTVGQSVTFSVSATGGTLSYQWYQSKAGASPIAGATSPSYTIASVVADDAANYLCIVTNSVGSTTSSSALLTVLTIPSIVTDPTSKTVAVGQSVTFSVAANGGNLSWQWYKGGTAISGATSYTYTIASVAASDAGSYYCVASNSVGSATSATAILTILAAPVITTQPQSQTKTVGQSVTFSVSATGGGLSYQWYQSKAGASPIAGATSSSYTIASVVADDAANYLCIVTNSVGSTTSSSALLTVLTIPSIVTDPTSKTVAVGQPVTFSVAANGGNLSWQWYKGGTAISGATSYSYTIASVAASDAGSYYCVASNSVGSATSATAVLSIATAPVITSQPTSFSVCQYAFPSSNLQVQVSSGAAYQYQWYMANGQPVAGETFKLFGTTPSATTSYYCIVTDPATNLTTKSSTATITILPVPASMPNITNTSWSPGNGPDASSHNLWVEIDNPNDGSIVHYSITNTKDHAYDVSDQVVNFGGNYAVWPAVGYGIVSYPANAITVTIYRVSANGCSSSNTFWNSPAWTPQP